MNVPAAPGVPGANMPPAATVVGPTKPSPVRMPPAFTVTAENAIEPFTSSTPPSTVVAPL